MVDYIDWSPFFKTWELTGKYPQILDDPVVGAEARQVFAHANHLLDRINGDDFLMARAVGGGVRAAAARGGPPGRRVA